MVSFRIGTTFDEIFIASNHSAFDYPLKLFFHILYRDLAIHKNRWHCDCNLLELHSWLQNFTVPNSVEPKCHSPLRVMSKDVKHLAIDEFACIPDISPNSIYLEVIEGKNMSLVCTITVRILLNFLNNSYLKLSKIRKRQRKILCYVFNFCVHTHPP